MTDAATPPEPGLVQKEINGLTYWFDEKTRKVHSAVSKAKAAAAHVVAPAPAVVAPTTTPAPDAPVVVAAEHVETHVENGVEHLVVVSGAT